MHTNPPRLEHKVAPAVENVFAIELPSRVGQQSYGVSGKLFFGINDRNRLPPAVPFEQEHAPLLFRAYPVEAREPRPRRAPVERRSRFVSSGGTVLAAASLSGSPATTCGASVR